MKKLTIIISLLFTVATLKAQKVPYEKLENFSKEISKLQFEANGKTYNDGKTDYEISFPEENFTILFNSQLATNVVYKKSNNKELMYLTENISLGRVVGFTSEIVDTNIVVWKINFGKFNVTTQIFENGKLINTTLKNELILYEYKNTDKEKTESSFLVNFSNICNTMKRSIGMITDEALKTENKDWIDDSITMADFVKKHPNSVRTMQLNHLIDDSEVYTKVEVMPEFAGGQVGLTNYFVGNLNYPTSAVNTNISGRVFISFVVDVKGSVKNIKVIRGLGKEFDEEVIRVIRLMPLWTPGYQNGKPVNVQLMMPITFPSNN